MAGKKRGFAAMTDERRKEVSRKGGMTSAAKGLGHRFTSEEAREARKLVKNPGKKKEPT